MFNVHDDLKNKDYLEIQRIALQDRLDFSIMLMNIEYDINIGNCIRTAHLMGVDTVYLFGRKRYDLRSTVGANHYQKIVKIEINLDTDCVESKFEETITNYKLNPIIIDKTINSKPITDLTIKKLKVGVQPLLVFGNEQLGIPEEITKKYTDNNYNIEQRGVIRSLNVSSAAAIAIHYFQNQLLTLC